eukprot:7047700-Prymnesium_polylepis.1
MLPKMQGVKGRSGKQLKKARCQACAAWHGARRRLQRARVTAAGGACGRLQWPCSGHALAAAGAAHAVGASVGHRAPWAGQPNSDVGCATRAVQANPMD